ncbi:hypothetical protein OUZ56_016562 [Daphnia magna]|uniref:Uncharacterized protein n=1 Tax=Daphnia magna TaxID=35525 RepID=A0ABR0AQW9_9CRUS|nr:hypothetical protein OUZ56_016562 [Daphnia magna]
MARHVGLCSKPNVPAGTTNDPRATLIIFVDLMKSLSTEWLLYTLNVWFLPFSYFSATIPSRGMEDDLPYGRQMRVYHHSPLDVIVQA